MKLTMQLTLDGLIRSLRLTTHALAEEAETRRPGERLDPGPPARRDGRQADDRAGR